MRYLSLLLLFAILIPTWAQEEENVNWLAFHSGPCGQIQLYNTHSNEIFSVTVGCFVEWSPDGQYLIYHHFRDGYFRYELVTQTLMSIYSIELSQIEQFGSFLTNTDLLVGFVLDEELGCQLYSINILTGDLQQFSEQIDGCEGSLVRPNIGEVLFLRADGIYSISDSPLTVTLMENIPIMTGARLSPDGTKIAFLQAEITSSIYLLDLRDMSIQEFPTFVEEPGFIWSAEDNRLIYSFGSQIGIIDIQTGDETILELLVPVNSGLESLEGNTLIYKWYGFTRLHREYIDIQTGERRVEIIDVSAIRRLSPDGCYEVFRFEGEYDLYVRRIGSTESIMLNEDDYGTIPALLWRPLPELTEENTCQ